MTLSAAFTVNSEANPNTHVAAYGSTVNLALTSLTGVNTIAWSIIAASKAGVSFPTITLGGSPLGATASFTMLSDPGDGLGRSLRIKCRVTDSAAAYAEEYAIVGAANGLGIVPISAGEELDRHATQGWTDAVNSALAAALPQQDLSTQSSNSTPITLATITLSDNTVYEFSCYAQAYAAAYASETVQKFSQIIRRSNGGSATTVDTLPELEINPLSITGLSLATSGNDVLIKWTGHSSTTLKATAQVGYTTHAIVLPS